MNTWIAIAALLVAPLESQWTKVGKAIEDRDPLGVGIHIALLVLYILALTATTCGLVVLACKYWLYLLIPVGIVWLIYYYAKKKPKAAPAPAPQPVEGIEEVQIGRASCRERVLDRG